MRNTRQGKVVRRSGWSRFVVVTQFVYTLLLFALCLYLLVLAYRSEIRYQFRDVTIGLLLVAAQIGGLGLLTLVSWFGMQKEKLWGWGVALAGDMSMAGILIYSMIDEGWRTPDWYMAGLTVFSTIVSACLLISAVQRFRGRNSNIGFEQQNA